MDLGKNGGEAEVSIVLAPDIPLSTFRMPATRRLIAQIFLSCTRLGTPSEKTIRFKFSNVEVVKIIFTDLF